MFFSFFLIIDVCFLIFSVTAQTFKPTVELVIFTGTQLKKQKQKWKHVW